MWVCIRADEMFANMLIGLLSLLVNAAGEHVEVQPNGEVRYLRDDWEAIEHNACNIPLLPGDVIITRQDVWHRGPHSPACPVPPATSPH